jgi:hypothetical protein
MGSLLTTVFSEGEHLRDDSRRPRKRKENENFTELADNAPWAADNYDKILHTTSCEQHTGLCLSGPSCIRMGMALGLTRFYAALILG